MGNDIQEVTRVNLPIEWGTNQSSMEAIGAMNGAMNQVGKHGIVATIPILCKGVDCPYYKTCPMATLNIDVETLIGQRCPVEVTKIMRKFEEYIEEFGIDLEKVDQVVISLVKELIDYDIQIERADNIMASDGHFLADTIVGVDANGRPIKNKEVSKPIEYKERATKKRHDILQLLHSTPKDKAGEKLSVTFDPSTYASKLIERAKALEGEGLINADYEVINDE